MFREDSSGKEGPGLVSLRGSPYRTPARIFPPVSSVRWKVKIGNSRFRRGKERNKMFLLSPLERDEKKLELASVNAVVPSGSRPSDPVLPRV